jgi:RNA polymerase sigma-70 factor (ECF subfamily)
VAAGGVDSGVGSGMERAYRLVGPHLDAAYNLASWLMHGGGDAEDAVHDALLRAARYIDSYGGRNAKAWWLSIVRNVCIDALSLGAGRTTLPIEELDELLQVNDGVAPSPELQAETRESAIVLGELLERLPAAFREVLILRELEDCSYREIADIVGVPIGTVMSRLARARALVRSAWRSRVQEG